MENEDKIEKKAKEVECDIWVLGDIMLWWCAGSVLN
jgi:hypothetical protein